MVVPGRRTAARHERVEHLGGAPARRHGVQTDGRQGRQGGLAERGVVVDAEDGDLVGDREAGGVAGVEDLPPTRVVRREDGQRARQTQQPLDERGHLQVPVHGGAARAGARVDGGTVPLGGQRGEKGVPPGERPVRFGEPRRVVGHLRRGGEGGADVGEVPEAAPEQVAGGAAPDRPVVAFHAGAGGERVAGGREGALRVEDDLGDGAGREAGGLRHGGDAGDDAVPPPGFGEALVADAARRDVERPGLGCAHVVDDPAQQVARDFQGRFHEDGDAETHRSRQSTRSAVRRQRQKGLKKIVIFLFRIVPACAPCAMLSSI